MTEQIMKYLELSGSAITLFAVVVIVAGFALTAGRYMYRFRALSPEQNFKGFKIEFGRALTLGLEILVLGDVIETITVKLTFQSLAVLMIFVIIRTFVSWTLTLEIENRWPWQASAEDHNHA